MADRDQEPQQPVEVHPSAWGVGASPAGAGQPERTRHVAHPPSRSTDHDIRCWRCKRLLIEMATRPWRVACSRCKATNDSPPLPGDEGVAAPLAVTNEVVASKG